MKQCLHWPAGTLSPCLESDALDCGTKKNSDSLLCLLSQLNTNNMTSCSAYQSPVVLTFVLGVALAVGIFGSYIPQHIKILQRKTSEGLSPEFLLLGSLSAVSALVNIFIVTIPARECCSSTLTRFQCTNSMVGLLQILLQTLGYVLIFVLCVFATRHSIRESKEDHQKLTINFYVFVVYVVGNVLTFLYLSMNPYKQKMQLLFFFADFSGIISTILSVIQYIPQLITTYRVKHAGSLSIPMMCLQTPGGYIWSWSLYSQPNSKWSSWLPYFAAANLQLVLLSMCVYFKYKYPTKLTEANAELRIAEENILSTRRHSVDETTTLLT